MSRRVSARAARRALTVAAAAAAVGAVAVVGTSAGSAKTVKASTSIAQAKAYVKSISATPKSINITTPLKKKPPKGKTIVFLVCSQPVCQGFQQGLTPAAAALGWHMKYISFPPTAAGEVAAFNQAIALHPAGIASTGLLRATIAAPYKTAQADHIPIVTGYATDAPAPPVIANVADGPHGSAPAAKAVADYIAVKSNCKADLLVFSITIYPILTYETQQFKKAFSSVCPSAKVKEDDVAVTSVGTTLPASVVSAVQADSKVNYVAFAFGDMAIGVSAALKAAGLSEPLLGYGAAGPENLTAITQGTETAVTGDGIPYGGWRTIDAFARYFEGMSTAPDTSTLNTTELFTSANAFATTTYNFAQPKNMAAQFEKLWHVSR